MVRNITKGVHWIPFVFSVGVVLQLLLALLGKGHGLGGTSNILVMLAFFIAVGGIFFLSYRYLRAGGQIKESLKKAAFDIKRLSIEMQDHEILQELLGREKVFSESKLDEAFEKFKEELKCIEKVGAADKYNIDTKVNIEDYINEELVDSAIQAKFLSQIPSTLTGLGILGTFLGLSIGLNSFELSGSAADVEANIGPLMDGIKVAFHTSICGLCFSIMYNFFYRKSHAEILECLDDFLDKFQKYVITSTDNGSANTFLKYQAFICRLLQEQTNLENAIMDRQDIRFGNLAKKLDEQNKQTLEIYKQINEKIAESQVKGIQKVVNAFVGHMNRALKGSFEELEEMIKSMCLYQKNAQGSLEAGLGQISTMYVNLAEINASLGDSVQQIKEFMDDTVCMQEMFDNNLTAVRAQMEQEVETLQAQSELLQRMAVQEEQLERAAIEQEERLVKAAVTQEERAVKMAVEQEGRIAETVAGLVERIGQATENQSQRMNAFFGEQERQMDEALCSFTGSIQEQAAAMTQMHREIETAIRQGISSVSKTAEACQNLQKKNGRENIEIYTQMQRSVEEISKVTGNMAHSVKTDIAAISKEVQGLSNYIGDSMKQTETEVLNIKQQIVTNIKSVDEIIRSFHAESDIRSVTEADAIIETTLNIEGNEKS